MATLLVGRLDNQREIETDQRKVAKPRGLSLILILLVLVNVAVLVVNIIIFGKFQYKYRALQRMLELC